MEKKKNSAIIIPSHFFTQNPLASANSDVKMLYRVGVVEKSAIIETTQQTEISTVNVVAEDKNVLFQEEKSTQISAFSLAGLKAKKILQEQAKPVTDSLKNLPTETFTKDQLLQYWADYTSFLGSKGQKILQSLLTISNPMVENNMITITLPNQGSKIDFEAAKPALLRFLEQKLQNFTLEIDIIVDEQLDKKLAFTPEDRYEKLRQLNPNIDLLRKAFDLDFS